MGRFEETKKKMISAWRGGKLEDCNSSDDGEEVELTESQLIRLDNMYNAAHELCAVITEEPDLEFDMYYVGTIVEFAVSLLLERGKPIRYPGIVTDDFGSRIEEYYSPDHIPSTKKIGGVEITKF